MLDSVELSGFPSCTDAISWSSDGELAVAVGDYFQILTPKYGKPEEPTPNATRDWHRIRVKANLFTHSEWPTFLAQDRDAFSIAAEQSNSIVVGLAWSPPGLGKFRRSILAVLTSNLLLSLWEAVGPQKQWTRISIVNHALQSHFEDSKQSESLAFRKGSIRSFTWCEPLKASTLPAGSSFLPAYEGRWGIPLLTVVNDLNEVVIVRPRRSELSEGSLCSHQLHVLAVHPLESEGVNNPHLCSSSLLQNAFKEKERASSASCGPWLVSPLTSPTNSGSAVAMLALVCGTQLRLLNIQVIVGESRLSDLDSYALPVALKEHHWGLLSEKLARLNITGPLKWLYDQPYTELSLVVGIMAGFITISVPANTYSGHDANFDALAVREWPIYNPETEENMGCNERHWEPISAMTTCVDEKNNIRSFGLGTLGGLGLITELRQLRKGNPLQRPRWKHIVEDHQEQFDLDHDLGGNSISRIWGLSSYRNVTAVLFTRHPTDMLEYRVASDDKSTIIFSSELEHDLAASFFVPRISNSQSPLHIQRESALNCVLPGDGDLEPDPDSQRLVHVAICCAITCGKTKSLLTNARKSLERLAVVTGADLSDEMHKYNNESTEIAPRSENQLNGPGGHIFERCDICDAGIGWHSPQEAKCANGHLFTRCGLSFLAIQEPGISKYCSLCHTEYIDEDSLALMHGGRLSRTFSELFEAFDTCLYCGGKFQPAL
ncbi:hypothetical protein PENANT_c044G03843 [Penicillium antarcticum]|uniref:Transcription factor IIIC putative zinc-finger domain-containing protein n=1 Tax=Penicillium antarcticum TaxID=416450 RepID=A0A1V6PS08_9EURO|nr:uncharacterized protein N7508_003971 [Penicillium antarcticum]KAJ5308592.1 hypothetical protein N7508_003971 [Penicillium antarcticum]OQD79785.1 hypothetical protein PENANT_c044G03843 [Penicillium antarcticum]